MKVYPTEDDRDFYLLISKYFELNTQDDASKKNYVGSDEIYNKIIDLIASSRVSPVTVVSSFLRLFSEFPTHKMSILFTIRSVIVTSKLNLGYTYPEFLWLLVNENVLYYKEINDNVMSSLVEICGKEIIRSYLHFVIIKEGASSNFNIVKLLYHVGYTVQTLKIITILIPFDQAHLELYRFIFSDAMAILYSDVGSILTNTEEEFLEAFFNIGLQSTDTSIVQISQKALVKLNEMED